MVSPYDLAHEGGVNTHLRALARVLRAAGHQVRILGPASGPVHTGDDALPGTVAIPANGSVARIGLLVPARVVERYLARHHFDLVHVHEPYVPGPARLAVRLATVPVVATFHAYAEREHPVSRVARRAMAASLDRLCGAIAASTPAADFARAVYGGVIRVIPNGIDTTAFGPGEGASSSAANPRDPLKLLFVGRYDEPRKGLVHFLEAAALLRAAGREVTPLVAGHGNPIRFAGLAARAGARFLGRLDDRALAAAYRDSDVFCAPSTYGESFGLVLLEAMACGRPVVASDIRGYREAAAGAALLVPPGDPAALAAAVVRVADDPAARSRMVELGRRRAAALDWHRVAIRVQSVYHEALTPPMLSRTRAAALAASQT